MRRSEGQATVELVALVPLLVALGFAVFAVLAAGRASAAAEAAAEAAAVAVLQGGDGAAAARRALDGWERTEVRVRGGRVRVSVRPALPVVDDLLVTTAEADAGPVPPPVPVFTLHGGDGASAVGAP